MSKCRKIVISVCLVVAIISGNMQNVFAAYPASNSLSVTRYAQEKSNWCWAACTKMVAGYLGHNVTQTGVVTYIKGSTVNEAASNSELVRALRFATSSNYSIGLVNVLSYASIQSYICSGKPLVLGMTWDKGGGHVVVIKGYTLERLVLVDPAAGTEIRSYAYDALKSGTTIQSGKGKYTNTWTIN